MDNPTIDKYGSQTWYNSKGEVHREGGPAYVKLDGTKAWFINGSWHREDGPAIILADDRKFWFIKGKQIQ